MTVPQVPNSVLREILAKASEASTDPERFLLYANDPLGFIRDVFGIPLWSAERPDVPGLTPDQALFIEAIFQHRRVVCRSGHGTGKSFALALVTLTWLYARKGRVVTTATTWRQVEDVLWVEIGSLFRKARLPLPALPGMPLLTELRVTEDWFAQGISTNDPIAFQGKHHPDLLVLIDEAPGVENPAHEAIRSLTTGARNHISMVGNPTVQSGAFYDAFRRGSWKKIHMSCLNHPNVILGREVIPGAVTREWVSEQREEYGEDSPIFQSRVLGEFPTMASAVVIPRAWAESAMEPAKMADAVLKAELRQDPVIFGVDVARMGDNKSVCVVRRGGAIIRIESWQYARTTESVSRVKVLAEEYKPAGIIVDEIGVGGGVLDQLQSDGLPAFGYHSGRPANAKTLFLNQRSAGWWMLRGRLERGELALPLNHELLAEMIAVMYSFSAAGKVVVETKDTLLARGIQSPDHVDALIMSLAYDEPPPDMVVQQERNRDHTTFEDNPFQKVDGYQSLMGAGW